MTLYGFDDTDATYFNQEIEDVFERDWIIQGRRLLNVFTQSFSTEEMIQGVTGSALEEDVFTGLKFVRYDFSKSELESGFFTSDDQAIVIYGKEILANHLIVFQDTSERFQVKSTMFDPKSKRCDLVISPLAEDS